MNNKLLFNSVTVEEVPINADLAGRTINILIAYPGMGKTTLNLKNSMFVDSDFGSYRKALTGKHFWELDQEATRAIHDSFTHKLLTEANSDPNKIWMTNEVTLIDSILSNLSLCDDKQVRILVVQPDLSFRPVWLDRLVKRNPDSEFAIALCKHVNQWLEDWISYATRMKDYVVSTGLDVILNVMSLPNHLDEGIRFYFLKD